MGSRHKKPGQSETTLNLTATAPALIGRPTLPASHGTGAEIPVGKASEFSGRRDGAGGHLELSSAHSGAREGSGGALSPVKVTHSKVVRGEFADNHRTARSEGNIRCKAFHDLNICLLTSFLTCCAVDYSTIIGVNHRRRAEFFQEKGKMVAEQCCCSFGGWCLAWVFVS